MLPLPVNTMNLAVKRSYIEFLLSISEEEILDKIIELRPESTKYSFYIWSPPIGGIDTEYINEVGMLPFTVFHNIKELFTNRRDRAKKWILDNYENLKGTICHIPHAKDFSMGQLLSVEFVVELAKSIAQKSGEGLEYATILAVFLVKAGLQKFCRNEWNN